MRGWLAGQARIRTASNASCSRSADTRVDRGINLSARRREDAEHLRPRDTREVHERRHRDRLLLRCGGQFLMVTATSSQNESPSAAATRTRVRTVGLTEPSSSRCHRL